MKNHPVRNAIIKALGRKEDVSRLIGYTLYIFEPGAMSCSELSMLTGYSTDRIRYHAKVLRNFGVVKTEVVDGILVNRMNESQQPRIKR